MVTQHVKVSFYCPVTQSYSEPVVVSDLSEAIRLADGRLIRYEGNSSVSEYHSNENQVALGISNKDVLP